MSYICRRKIEVHFTHSVFKKEKILGLKFQKNNIILNIENNKLKKKDTYKGISQKEILKIDLETRCIVI